MSKRIKFLVMDVDGTLTDGKIYMGNDGELFKAFDIKDGFGIKDLLPQVGIVPIIITARESKILENRCRELEISEFYQGIKDKKKKLNEILSNYSQNSNIKYTFKNAAYIGDDICDLQCMKAIKETGGIVGCPSNAVKDIRAIADFVSSKNGGAGAVREFIEWLITFLNLSSRICIYGKSNDYSSEGKEDAERLLPERMDYLRK